MTRAYVLCIALALAACAGREVAPAASEAAAPAPAEPSSGAEATGAPLVAIPNAAQPEPGVLTGGPPTAQNLQEAATAGYRTVISLQMPDEPGASAEREQVEALGLRFVSIPIAGAADLTEEKARELGAVLQDAANKPAILHCGTGNRAGALLALEAFYVRGQSADAALELGKRAGLTKLEPAVREQLQAAAKPQP